VAFDAALAAAEGLRLAQPRQQGAGVADIEFETQGGAAQRLVIAAGDPVAAGLQGGLGRDEAQRLEAPLVHALACRQLGLAVDRLQFEPAQIASAQAQALHHQIDGRHHGGLRQRLLDPVRCRRRQVEPGQPRMQLARCLGAAGPVLDLSGQFARLHRHAPGVALNAAAQVQFVQGAPALGEARGLQPTVGGPVDAAVLQGRGTRARQSGGGHGEGRGGRRGGVQARPSVGVEIAQIERGQHARGGQRRWRTAQGHAASQHPGGRAAVFALVVQAQQGGGASTERELQLVARGTARSPGQRLDAQPQRQHRLGALVQRRRQLQRQALQVGLDLHRAAFGPDAQLGLVGGAAAGGLPERDQPRPRVALG